ALGPRAAVLSLVGNERFTNATYETALEFVSNPEARALLEKNFEDEQRHLAWLLQYAERTAHGEELHEGTSPSAQPSPRFLALRREGRKSRLRISLSSRLDRGHSSSGSREKRAGPRVRCGSGLRPFGAWRFLRS